MHKFLAGLAVTLALPIAVLAFALPVPVPAQGAGAEPPLLLVQAGGRDSPYFDETLAERAGQVAGVARVERVLRVETEPHDIIGVMPGERLRIVTGDGRLFTVRVKEGRDFEAGDAGRPVAIVGSGTAIEDYAPGTPSMSAGMKHPFSVGSSFLLPGTDRRVRVVGLYTGTPNDRVFFPLDTVQALFGQRGKVSHLVITLRPSAAPGAVKEALRRSLGAELEVLEVR